jgi:hypothetical protein
VEDRPHDAAEDGVIRAGQVKTAPVGSNVVTCVVPAFPAAFAGSATMSAAATAASADRTAIDFEGM